MEQASSPEVLENRAARTLREIFQSGRPLTYVHSAEEQRVEKLLHEAGSRLLGEGQELGFFNWSLTEGLRQGQEAIPGTQNPRAALDFIVGYEHPAIFHLKDFHEHLRESAEIRRRLRDIYESCLGRHKFVVITSAVKFIPEEIARSIVVFDLRPPDLLELTELVREEAQRMAGPGATPDLSEETLYPMARALQGLTVDEARHAMHRALAAGLSFGVESIAALLEEKRLLVSRSGIIEAVIDDTDIDRIGGLGNLKDWLMERRTLFQMRDNLSSEMVPKGILIMGIPGCGKSLTIKAIARCFELPLYRIDMIEVFSGRHGKPEGAFVETCKTLEELAPAVVWFDEIEMAISSAESSGEQGRMFAFFLTWMQEKARGLFVAATANRIDLLPAEMIRKGRFDEVFFVDLPQEDERIEIFKIHIQRRGLDPAGYDFTRLVNFTKGWTGSEVEQCVVAALTKAKMAGRALTNDDLIIAATNIVPLSRTMKEQINHIREWAFERAIVASRPTLGRSA